MWLEKKNQSFGCQLLSQYLKNMPGGSQCGLFQCFPQAENLLKVVDPVEGAGGGGGELTAKQH